MKRAHIVMTAHFKRPLNDSEILIKVELGGGWAFNFLPRVSLIPSLPGDLKSIRAQNMNQIWKEEHRTASTGKD